MSTWCFGLEVGLDILAWRRASEPRPYAVFLARSSTIRCTRAQYAAIRNLDPAHAYGPT
jgi:hypothetical protein